MTTDAHQAIVNALERGDYTPAPLQRFKRPITHRQGLTARLGALEHAHGGEQAAAEAAGVTARTWRVWKRNPRARLSVKSMRGVEQAYEADLTRRNDDPLRKLRYALSRGHKALVIITAEVQWDGYYNGQAEKVALKRPEAPQADNRAAHRTVKFGTYDIQDVIRAWKNGHDTYRPLLELVRDSYGNAWIFFNSYYQNVSVTL